MYLNSFPTPSDSCFRLVEHRGEPLGPFARDSLREMRRGVRRACFGLCGGSELQNAGELANFFPNRIQEGLPGRDKVDTMEEQLELVNLSLLVTLTVDN